MSYTVRFAQAGDEDAIARLLVSIHAQHAEGRPDLFGGGHAKHSASDVLAMFGNKNAPIFVAVDHENTILGYAICVIKQNHNPAQREYATLYLDDLNVHASARRLGVGTALLDACRAYGKETGCYNLTLNVWSFNEGAVRFYEKNGFTPQRMILEDIL